MSFSEEARKFALQKQAEEKEADRQAKDEWQADCIRRLRRWFDQVGMLPKPSLRIGEATYTNPVGESGGVYYHFYATWQYDGYEYEVMFVYPHSSVEVKIKIGGALHWARTKEEIGLALLQK